ncbi:hypothetical protein THAOC_07200 [Thalassiosira oceanica]|uniref:Uncharacterized protein n=1 Tax=Thalassiosira oceanica TaxID=159749 RepID=K0TD15_THAOC|nr:hypothetical protein THAOC_07200 [Thalassiosira oceanica]|eukprot:EJK71371.1 hypothetical protein THAOC_07200 [Thalassiosira oceanica]
MKFNKFLMNDKSDPKCESYAGWVKLFEEEYGVDLNTTMIKYDNDFLNLPRYVFKAVSAKTCVVEEYIEISDQYRVRMEFTNEVLLLDSDNLKRRDRTPQDPGYYVECKNNRLIHRDFKSNEECQAFIASLGSDVGELSKVGSDARSQGGAGCGRSARGVGLGRP